MAYPSGGHGRAQIPMRCRHGVSAGQCRAVGFSLSGALGLTSMASSRQPGLRAGAVITPHVAGKYRVNSLASAKRGVSVGQQGKRTLGAWRDYVVAAAQDED